MRPRHLQPRKRVEGFECLNKALRIDGSFTCTSRLRMAIAREAQRLIQNLETITSIKIEMGDAPFKKEDGNWTQTKSNLSVHRWMLLMQLQCNSSIRK